MGAKRKVYFGIVFNDGSAAVALYLTVCTLIMNKGWNFSGSACEGSDHRPRIAIH
jgi:hypothetical protein